MLADRTVQFADEVLDLIDDFVPGLKTRIIAEQLVRSATSTAANYRAAQRAGSRAEFSSKMCTVWRDPSEWTGLNCSSASFSWFFSAGFLGCSVN